MTTTDTTIAQRVIAALHDQTERPAESIRHDHSLVADLHMDSLDIVEAVMRAEEACDVDLPDEQVQQLTTVADLVALVERVRGAA